MPLSVSEIFYSIQGESLWMGLPCVFVRLSGCNLRCRYCDTRYAYAPGDQLTTVDIVRRIEKFECPRVTVTGGEPLLQEEARDLITELLDSGYAVNIETNGSISIDGLDPRCIKILDIKCPSSGMQDHNYMPNIPLLGPGDQIKFVIADKKDFEFALSAIQGFPSHIDAEHILFSPVYGRLAAEQLAQWILAARARGRLQVQLHKYLWPNIDRGV